MIIRQDAADSADPVLGHRHRADHERPLLHRHRLFVPIVSIDGLNAVT